MRVLHQFPRGPSVSIIVGENGSGKSRFLRDVAKEFRRRRSVYAVSNTVYDRFVDLHGITRLSVSSGRNLPSRMLKNAIRTASDDGIARLRAIANTLAYCGYSAQIGLLPRLRGVKTRTSSVEGVPRQSSAIERSILDRLEAQPEYQAADRDAVAELGSLISLLVTNDGADVRWLDFSESDAFQSSRDQQYALLVKWETLLKSAGVIRGIDVFVRRLDGVSIPLAHASSGELTLIASFAFLSASIGGDAMILIDEPENSLHPRWQKEYVERLLALLKYREPTIVIATHAPIIVSGAKLLPDANISVFEMANDEVSPIQRRGSTSESESLEETLFQTFGTVTPANHYVSEVLVSKISEIRAGTCSASDIEELVAEMKNGSFDADQLDFFDSVIELAKKVEADNG